MMQRTAVVTGGNGGIGFETAKVLARRGWRVIITGRDEAKLSRAVTAIHNESGSDADYRIGDFASFASVRDLAAALLTEPRIDVLVNNAGVSLSRRILTVDGNEMVLQVNHLAPFLLTHLLLDRIKASAPARIVNVSSRSYRFVRDPGFEDFQFARSFSAIKSYTRTKFYNILFTRELARRLNSASVMVNAVHPGSIVSQIGMDGDYHGIMRLLMKTRQPLKSPLRFGSKVTVFAATSTEIESVTGEYFSVHLKAERLTRAALDDDAARRLWDLSCSLVGLSE